MHLFITGGTGFIGQALCAQLQQRGYRLTLLSRQAPPNHNADPNAPIWIRSLDALTSLDGVDAIINLAGEPIFDRRWTLKQKQMLVESRLHLTQTLAKLCRDSVRPPTIFLSASATGYYGDMDPSCQTADEQAVCGTDFAAQLCQKWENAALDAASHTTRVCLLRTGMVLHPSGGVLKRLIPLYHAGLGAQLGHGRQQWAWISRTDVVRAILFLLEHPTAQGAFNVVAPQPITQAAFHHHLAKILHRPTFPRVPAWIVRGLLGERAQLLFAHQPLIPTKLREMGFVFEETQINTLLTSGLKEGK